MVPNRFKSFCSLLSGATETVTVVVSLDAPAGSMLERLQAELHGHVASLRFATKAADKG